MCPMVLLPTAPCSRVGSEKDNTLVNISGGGLHDVGQCSVRVAGLGWFAHFTLGRRLNVGPGS